MAYTKKDFLEGVAISAACAALPVRKVYPVVGDLLDNEWPIEWKASEVKGNKGYVSGSMTFRRISDAIGYDYENAACAVTAVGDGVSAAFTTKNIGATDQSLGKLIYIQCTLNSTNYILALLVIETPGTEGTVEFTETGTYYAFLNSSYVNVEFSNADLQFSLTAPQLVGYSYNGVVLPKLPEWDREAYPYAALRRGPKYDWGGGTYVDLYLWETAGIVKPHSVNSFITNYYLCTTGKAKRYQIADATAIEFAGMVGVDENVTEPEVWTLCEEYDFAEESRFFNAPDWTNHDMYNEDGTVYLAASEPIPIYE